MTTNEVKTNWLWKYAEETPFHGLSMARRSWNRTELITWLGMVFLCIVMTIQQTVNLANVYLSEPTGTSTTIRKNETITFPNLVLCVNQPYFLGMSFETNLDLVQGMLQNITASDIESIKKGGVPSLNADLIKMISEIVRSMTQMELRYVFNQNPQNAYWAMSAGKILFPYQNAAVSAVFRFFKSRNVTLASLSRLAAAQMCNLMKLNISMNWYNTSSVGYYHKYFNVCRSDAVTSMSLMGFCVRLDQDIVFHNAMDNLQITANPEIVFPDIPGYKGALHLDTSGRDFYAMFVNKGNIIKAEFGKKTAIDAHIQGQYKSESLRRAPCSSSLTKYDCEMGCYGTAVYSACQCWPIIINNMRPQNVPFCLENVTLFRNETIPFPVSIPIYKYCLLGALKYPIDMCRQKCLTDCDYQQVVFFTDDTSYYFVDDSATVLTVTVADFVYPLFVENLIQDWQTILNAFGGNIGLWLGGSLRNYSSACISGENSLWSGQDGKSKIWHFWHGSSNKRFCTTKNAKPSGFVRPAVKDFTPFHQSFNQHQHLFGLIALTPALLFPKNLPLPSINI